MIRVYKDNIIESLRYLADENLQRLAWLGETDICSSFVDEVDAIFTESGLGTALERNEIIFGKAADEALRELEKAADAIGYKRPEAELIISPEMSILRQKAAHALALVEASDWKESTVRILNAGEE